MEIRKHLLYLKKSKAGYQRMTACDNAADQFAAFALSVL
jgi:hypothetical protein